MLGQPLLGVLIRQLGHLISLLWRSGRLEQLHLPHPPAKMSYLEQEDVALETETCSAPQNNSCDHC